MSAELKRKVLVVYDHPILREGIAWIVSRQDDLIICGEAEEHAAALALAQELQPDVAIVDLTLKDGGGHDLIRQLSALEHPPSVVVLGTKPDSERVEQALRAGARAYVTGHEAAAATVDAIHEVLKGGIYVSTDALSSLMTRLATGTPLPPANPLDPLSPREREVFEGIGRGQGRHEIADGMHLSVKTVDAQRERIKKKLGLQRSQDLLKVAIAWVRDHPDRCTG